MAVSYLISGPITPVMIESLIAGMAEKTDSGGHSIFLGQVRADSMQGKRVKAIEYSAYDSMVSPEAEKIMESVKAKFDDVKSIEIIHSTGIVNAGFVSLLVFVSAGHRKQAMQACSETVELIKEKLPVWKKEIFDDESYIWK